VSLAWVRERRGVTSVIIGPRTLGQLQHNMPGFELELPPEIISRLNDASRPADRLPRR
jgi:aryl-alcohol dehydrogenase-like predicted oxidoreductase